MNDLSVKEGKLFGLSADLLHQDLAQLEKYISKVNERIASWTFMMVEGLEPKMLEHRSIPFAVESKVYKELSEITQVALELITGLGKKPKGSDPYDLTEMKALFVLIKTHLFPATETYFMKGS